METETQNIKEELMQVLPYLGFEGNAAEAVKLYEQAFEGQLIFTMLYKESDEMAKKYPDYRDKIFHGEMKIGDGYLYLYDLLPGTVKTTGNSINIHINFNFTDQLEHAYNVLKKEGSVKTKIGDTFWGARYGAVIDKFGNCWSLNYQYPKKDK